jgi:HlyD family secretion protein
VEHDLQKLRIDKSQKARRDEKPIWPWALVALLLLGLGFGVWQWQSASAAPSVQTIRVRIPDGTTAPVDRVLLNATGYVMAAHKIELAAKVVGKVAWVGVEMGDKIKKDQVLVRLEDDDYKARVAQVQGEVDAARAKLAELHAGSRPQEIASAKALLEQAQAELKNAQISLDRLKDLAPTKSVSQQQIDDAEALVRSRQAQVDSQQAAYDMTKVGPRQEEIDSQAATVRQLEGSLALSKIDLQNTVIHSPIDGTVLERNVEVGEFVTTGFVGDKGAKGYVVSIADLNDLQITLDVSQNDFAKVAMDQPCWIVTDAYPDKKYTGAVNLISPEANRQKATVEVRVKVTNPDDQMKPDMNATVSFLTPEKLAAASSEQAADHLPIRVPASAVRNGAVFVVENGKALRRTVEMDKTTGRDVEIRKGLIGGEDLIVSPPETLQDGAQVKVTEAKG